MRAEARPDGRARIRLRPIDEFGERAPVRLLAQVGRARLGAGDDQTVQAALPQLVERRIALLHTLARGAGADDLRQAKQFHADAAFACRSGQQSGELPFGLLQRRVRHIVDEANVETLCGRCALARRCGAGAPLRFGRNAASRLAFIEGYAHTNSPPGPSG